MAIIIDVRGSASPLAEIEQTINTQGVPVIALTEDDKIRQKIEGLAVKLGFSAFADKMENGTYRIVIQSSALDMFMLPVESASPNKRADIAATRAHPLPQAKLPQKQQVITVFSSDHMGDGEPQLGQSLLQGFLFALTELPDKPETILLYNSGVKLAAKGTQTAIAFKMLEESGVEILACQMSTSHYGLSGKLAAGKMVNMYQIAEKLRYAAQVIRP